MADPNPTKTDAQGQKVPGTGTKTQWVVSNRDDDRVALWEPHLDHPEGGEAWVAGKVPAEVALTPEVNARLRDEQLRPATEAEIAKRKAQLAQMDQPSVAKGPWD
jgi:hypothetical protein